MYDAPFSPRPRRLKLALVAAALLAGVALPAHSQVLSPDTLRPGGPEPRQLPSLPDLGAGRGGGGLAPGGTGGPVEGDVVAEIGDVPAVSDEQPAVLDANTIQQWQKRKTIRLGGGISSAAVSGDRRAVAFGGGRDGSVFVLDAQGQVTDRFKLPKYKSHTLSDLAFLPGRQALVVAIEGKGLEVYSTKGKKLAALAGSEAYTYTLKAPPGGNRLYAVLRRSPPAVSNLDVYEIDGGKIVRTARYDLDTMPGEFDVSPDGTLLLLYDRTRSRLSLLGLPGLDEQWSLRCTCSGAFADGGRQVVAAGRFDGATGNFSAPVSFLRVATDAPDKRVTYEPGSKETLSVSDVSADGKFVAITTTNIGRTYIVEAAEDDGPWQPLGQLDDGSKQNVQGGFFVGDGSFLVGSGDNNARLWRR